MAISKCFAGFSLWEMAVYTFLYTWRAAYTYRAGFPLGEMALHIFPAGFPQGDGHIINTWI